MTRDEIIANKANLREANLRWADLSGADLLWADLSGADLLWADLRGASLRGANLREANLRWADLSGADLLWADLRGADLSRANGIICLGLDPRGYRFVGVRHEEGWMISAGCRWFTVPEAIKHWKGKKNKDALARVAILKAHP